MAQGALLGVVGIFIMTASGVFIGYWQARAGYVVRTHDAVRFLKWSLWITGPGVFEARRAARPPVRGLPHL